jgi:hypothetical protein
VGIARTMTFLLRMAFWLTVVIVCLPSPGARPVEPRSLPSATRSVAALADFGRNAYRWLTKGAEQPGKFSRDAKASQDTLRPADLAVPWRAPAPRKVATAKASI